ncbi:50S ribosomal protein L20 [Candidatus Acetothermia bacterium]|nr:50S ribosomal protein L20 [Candidatus Acetothermia bacterium]MBI3644199.1 50S ribosomal protein L20 [Candidatus Acetothermia bacterium]
MRVKGGMVHAKQRRKILKLAKGFGGKKSTSYRIAKQRVMKALRNAYYSRRLRRRDFRNLWIIRVNAASRARGIVYSRFMEGLHKAGIGINRKMLADIAVRDGQAFDELVELAKSHSTAPAN